MNEEFLKYIEKRLLQWAEWYSRGDWYGLGYPSSSIEYKLMTEGYFTRDRYAPRVLPSNSEAEEMELIIKEMSSYNQKMALALRYYYFTDGSLREKSKKMEISHMQFKYYVDLAHQWLAGRLSSKKRLKLKYSCNVNT